MSDGPRRLARMTYEEVAAACASGKGVVLMPVGSVEPHGPHLPLGTDTTISEVACERAASMLAADGLEVVLAPSLPYGVTDYARGFAGAVGVPEGALVAFLGAIVSRLVDDGWAHVCVVNNHLEPAHDAAVRASIGGLPKGRASVACPLTRRWGRTLSDEFKRGDCHAGRYETSLVLAAGEPVGDVRGELPSLGISLAEAIRQGKSTFAEIGMDRAYTGAPSEATREEGDAMYAKLAEMIATEVREGLVAR
ncbi:MAG: creatininase family protein [Polyangiaceae bacterium]